MSTTKDPGLGNDDISKKRREKQRQAPKPPEALSNCLHTRPLEGFDASWCHLIERSVGITLGAHRVLLIIETSAPRLLAGYFADKGIAHARFENTVVAPVLDTEGKPITTSRQGVLSDLERLAAFVADEISLAVWEVRSLIVIGESEDILEGEAIDLDRTLFSHNLDFKYKVDCLTPLPHPANIETVFERHPDIVNGLRWDELRFAVMIQRPLAWMPTASSFPRVWDDDDSFHCAAWLLRTYGLSVETRAVSGAAKTVARKTIVHPIREKLRSFEWDGEPRLETWLTSYFGVTDTPYARLAGQYWMRSAVARAFETGCEVHTLLILEGSQGTGKSRGIKALCEIVPGVVRDTPLPIGEKDAFQQLDGVWIYELAELNGFDRQSASKLKAFFSSPEDNYRRSYGETVKAIGRRVVFIGSINPEDGKGYFTDTTGNRRYWPVEVKHIDIEALLEDREQLWAEAVAQYRKTRRWWPTPEETPLFVEEQAKRVSSDNNDPWVEKLREELPKLLYTDVGMMLRAGEHVGRPYDCLTTSKIMAILDIPPRNQPAQTGERVRRVMQVLGYSAAKSPIRSHTGKTRHWSLKCEAQRREVLAQLIGLEHAEAIPASAVRACLRLKEVMFEPKIDVKILGQIIRALEEVKELQELTTAAIELKRWDL